MIRVGLQPLGVQHIVHFVCDDLYSFPIAAVTNYHIPTHYQFIISQSGDQKVKISLTGITSGCWQGWFLLEALTGSRSPASPLASGVCGQSLLVSWVVDSSL